MEKQQKSYDGAPKGRENYSESSFSKIRSDLDDLHRGTIALKEEKDGRKI